MVQRSSGRGCWYRLVLSPDVRCVVKPALRASVDCPFCSSPASRIQRPASSARWRPQPTTRTFAIAFPPSLDVQFELVVVVSQHAPHRTPQRPPTSVQHQQPAARTSIGHPSRTITLPFHPSTRLHPSSSRSDGPLQIYASSHSPAVFHQPNPPHTPPPSTPSPRALYTATQRSARHRPPVTRLSICALHSRTHLLCTAPAPSCARLTLAAPPRLPFCVARASPSRQ